MTLLIIGHVGLVVAGMGLVLLLLTGAAGVPMLLFEMDVERYLAFPFAAGAVLCLVGLAMSIAAGVLTIVVGGI